MASIPRKQSDGTGWVACKKWTATGLFVLLVRMLDRCSVMRVVLPTYARPHGHLSMYITFLVYAYIRWTFVIISSAYKDEVVWLMSVGKIDSSYRTLDTGHFIQKEV